MPAPVTAPARGTVEAAQDEELGEVARASLLERIPGMLANQGKPFSKKEATELYDEVMEALEDYCEALDWVLGHINKKQTKCEVWASLDDDDLGTFADLAILRAQRSARAATAVRKLIELRYYLSAGMITVDGMARSAAFIAQEGGLWLPPINLGLRFGSASAR